MSIIINAKGIKMFSKFGMLITIILGYVYLTSTDSDKTLYTKTKTMVCECYKDIQKDVKESGFEIKVNKSLVKEKRFF